MSTKFLGGLMASAGEQAVTATLVCFQICWSMSTGIHALRV
jgi:hypothetical protein